ncbi:hypothetical protein PODOV084v1_p0005 [Vibrio phage 340E47.2]|nr:hypothetical protein PODOV084v1_p0005 [Vibrio phage 340E47.2]QZI91963.1 putative major capsid protein [Vibrio phage 5P1a]
MNNNYQSNINKKLLKSFAKSFESQTVLTNTVSKQLVNDFDPSTGRGFGQVALKRPPQYTPQRTIDGDLTAGMANPVRVGQVQAEVSNYITVYVENTQVEEALEADQLDELLMPIAEDMIIELETELALYMASNSSLISGDPDNQINAWSDIAAAGAYLKEIGAPSGKKYAVINSFDETELADLQTQLGVNSEVMTAWDGAVIKKHFAGFQDVMTSNNLPQYTAGNQTSGLTLGATPAATYTAYQNTYRMSLVITGATANTGMLRQGQTLEFPGTSIVNMRNRKLLQRSGSNVPFTVTVLEDATADGSGNMTVSVSGAAIFESGVNSAFNTVNRALTSGDAVNVLDSTANQIVRPALAYCEGAFGMGSVVLPKLHALDSMVMNHKGISIRVHRFSDGVANRNRYRFDLLPTFATFNPQWAMKMHGRS